MSVCANHPDQALVYGVVKEPVVRVETRRILGQVVTVGKEPTGQYTARRARHCPKCVAANKKKRGDKE